MAVGPLKFYLQCSDCERRFGLDEGLLLCPSCSSAQDTSLPPRGLLDVMLPGSFAVSNDPLDWLPAERSFIPDLPVGNTPLWRSRRLCGQNGFQNLWLKNEGVNPTGSLKDRASQLVAAWAVQHEKKGVYVASTGNAAASMAGIGAASGLKVHVFMPASAPKEKIRQCAAYGASLHLVHGAYSDALQASSELASDPSLVCRNTGINPLTIEGKKTVSIEIVRQLEGKAPDCVFVPTGDGVILSGVYKGFADLARFGIIPNIPKIVAVQAEGSQSIHRAWQSGSFSEPAKPAATKADSIAVQTPLGGRRALAYLRQHHGVCATVMDEDILRAQKELASLAGLFAEPAAAAAYAGFLKLSGAISKDASVVLLITGHGLKDPSAVSLPAGMADFS